MKYEDFENMSCIDILVKVLYSTQFLKENCKPEDALSKEEIEVAMTIALEKCKEEQKTIL